MIDSSLEGTKFMVQRCDRAATLCHGVCGWVQDSSGKDVPEGLEGVLGPPRPGASYKVA
jgi:hypothetical protein